LKAGDTAAQPQATRQALLAAIQALEQQRAGLGDAVVDPALQSLRQQLEALADPPAPTPERRLRQVSVLFLDIVGSTAMGQRLEPEDIGDVVDGALADFSAIVSSHGGQVLQYAGDNLLAAFGVDNSQEDDAECAVRCGLALLAAAARHGERVLQQYGHDGFNARVGIHTGSVLRGGGVDHDNSLRGQAVNIAARMEQTAPAGRLRISQDTWALVRGLFDAEAQAPLDIKGSDEPVASWLVLGDKPRPFRLPTRGIEGLETPLVGRQAEREALEAALQAVQREGHPVVVTLVADAGLGKSRLLQEFQHRLAAGDATFWLLLARSQPSGQLQPYGLLRDLLARRFEIADSDSAESARSKLVQGLAPWLNVADDPAPELLGHLVGIDFSAASAVQACGNDARLLRTMALSGLQRMLQRMAAPHRGAGVVLLLDDLQWSDDASLDALQSLVAEVQGALLVVACARPALLERRPAWGEGLPRHVRLTLAPLDNAQRLELTQQLLRRLTSPAPALSDLIEGRAEGNPYHAEELLRMLLDHRVIESAGGEWVFHPLRLRADRVPTTLVGVLQSRLDALGRDERRSLQLASVIGPVFWDAALGELDARGPEALPALQRKAMVFVRPSSAFEETTERAFQHHLLHQVTYETLLKSERQNAHALAAAWLTERVGQRGDEYLAITAQHHERAGQPQLAAQWLERASDAAGARFAIKLGLNYLERAILLRGSDATPAVQMANLRRRAILCDGLGLYGPQRETLDALLALANEHRDDSLLAFAFAQRSLLNDRQSRSAEAEADARAGAEVAARNDDAGARRAVPWQSGLVENRPQPQRGHSAPQSGDALGAACAPATRQVERRHLRSSDAARRQHAAPAVQRPRRARCRTGQGCRARSRHSRATTSDRLPGRPGALGFGPRRVVIGRRAHPHLAPSRT
jgi:class 3 adenylate cyclase